MGLFGRKKQQQEAASGPVGSVVLASIGEVDLKGRIDCLGDVAATVAAGSGHGQEQIAGSDPAAVQAETGYTTVIQVPGDDTGDAPLSETLEEAIEELLESV